MGKLEELKAEADMLEITYDDKITFKALESKIKKASKARQDMIDKPKDEPVKAEVVPDVTTLRAGTDTTDINIHPSEKDISKGKEKDPLKEARRLIFIKIVNMNPETQDDKTVHISISNAAWGKIAERVIPFNTPKPWAVEKCILDKLMSETYPLKKEIKKGSDTEIDVTYLPKFGIQVFPAPTRKELENLASDQRKTDRLKD